MSLATISPIAAETARPAKTVAAPRLHILEGLRGYMAWWVVFGHFLIEAGFHRDWLPSIAKVAIHPGYAVDVFVILSGFVITHLLSTQQISYRVFLTRRFFRLFPLFFITLLVGLLSFKWVYSDYFRFTTLVDAQAQSPSAWAGYHTNLLKHFLVSVTMLHGAVPNAWLPNAQAAFVSPGWSVSLEWQFYLLIPAVLWAFKRQPGWTAAVVVASLFFRHNYAIGEWGSFLPQHAEYFILGILSYHLLQYMKDVQLKSRRSVPWVFSTLFLLLALVEPFRDLLARPYEVVVGDWVPLVIWLLTFAILLEAQSPVPGVFSKILSAFLLNPLAQWLGKVSYSTYLVHYFVIYFMMGCLLRLHVNVNKYTALAAFVAVGVPILLILSWLSHKLIEAPGVEMGRFLCTGKTHVTRSPR
jgi:peptidoglycan/LPS O-acetylase OafA/YrhL